MFSGTLRKPRKPEPRYSSFVILSSTVQWFNGLLTYSLSLNRYADNIGSSFADQSTLSFARLYGQGNRKTSGRPSSSDTTPTLKKDKRDSKDSRIPAHDKDRAIRDPSSCASAIRPAMGQHTRRVCSLAKAFLHRSAHQTATAGYVRKVTGIMHGSRATLW